MGLLYQNKQLIRDQTPVHEVFLNRFSGQRLNKLFELLAKTLA